MWWIIIFLVPICHSFDGSSDDDERLEEEARARSLKNETVIRCHDEIKEVGITPDGHKILKLFRTSCRWEKLIKDE